MLVIRQSSEAQLIQDKAIRDAVEARMVEWSGDVLDGEGLPGYFLIVEASDSLDDLQGHLGFDPLANRYTGLHFGQSAFTPSFEMVESHGTFYEVVFVLSDEGLGVVVVVPDLGSMPEPLRDLCRQYAIPAKEPAP